MISILNENNVKNIENNGLSLIEKLMVHSGISNVKKAEPEQKIEATLPEKEYVIKKRDYTKEEKEVLAEARFELKRLEANYLEFRKYTKGTKINSETKTKIKTGYELNIKQLKQQIEDLKLSKISVVEKENKEV